MKHGLFFLMALAAAAGLKAQHVGINNTSPQTALDIEGRLRIRPAALTVTGPTVTIPNGNTGFVTLNGTPGTNFTVSLPTGVAGSFLLIENTTAHTATITGLANILPGKARLLLRGSTDWILASDAESQLEKITEAGNTGWRIFGRNAVNYGNTGQDAVDLSFSSAASEQGATGAYATAMGYNTTASGNNATAMGNQTTAKAYASLAIGAFNDTIAGASPTAWAPNDPLLTIGNGLGPGLLSNAMTVYKNGSFDLQNLSSEPGVIANKFYVLNSEPCYSGKNLHSQLEKITEAGNTGWRIFGRDPANYGNIGFAAVDLSYNTIPSSTHGATGTYAFTTGENTTAGNPHATAMGAGTVANGFVSTALGFNTTANGTNSIAMGGQTTANGEASAAMGRSTIAGGAYSTAMGFFSNAGGQSALATGEYTNATGTASTAMGYTTTAGGFYSTAMGSNTAATGSVTTAMGVYTTAKAYASLAIGQYNDTVAGSNPATWVVADPVLTIGNGLGPGSLSNAMTVYKNGTFGLQNLSSEPSNFANKFYVLNSEPYYNGKNLHSQLEEITEAGNTGWRLLGRNPNNYGNIGVGAVDLSYSNFFSSTNGATGSYSTATGFNTAATGDYSTAMGISTIARDYVSVVIGQYNAPVPGSNPTAWVSTDPLFVIGNGTSSSSVSNAFMVYKNGNADLSGFTRLGTASSGSPAIKIIKINTTLNASANATVAHGLTESKILQVRVKVTNQFNSLVFDGNTVANNAFNAYVDGVNIIIAGTAGNSNDIVNRPAVILITYEE